MPLLPTPSPDQVPALRKMIPASKENSEEVLRYCFGAGVSGPRFVLSLDLADPWLLLLCFPCPVSFLCDYLKPRCACCSSQSRFSPSISRSQYSPTNKPLGFCSERFSTSRRM